MMDLIQTFSRFGAGKGAWLNVSGGNGNESLAALSVASVSHADQCIAIRMVLEDGSAVPILNPRELKAYKSARIRLPGIFLKAGQRLECYSSEHAEFNMTLTRVNGGRPRTNRISVTPAIGADSVISTPGSPLEITSVLCINKTEAEARVAMSFRTHPGGAAGTIFLDEIVPAQATYRAALPNQLIAGNQSLEVFSTADCAWVISGVTA